MKILIVGAGNVGAHIAYLMLFTESVDEVLIYDVQKELILGKALDLNHSAGVLKRDIKFTALDSLDKVNADIVVITAGLPRKEGMSRFDLLEVNIGIMDKVIAGLNKDILSSAIFIVVSNPVDILTYYFYKKTLVERKRVIGMAGALDAGRFRFYLSENLNKKISALDARVIGSHSKEMLCLFKNESKEVELSKKDTQEAGTTVVSYYKGGSAYFAPAAGVKVMVEAITSENNEIIDSVAVLDGEYGYCEIAFGVPVKLCLSGIKEIVELDLTEIQKKELEHSIKGIKEAKDFLKTKGIVE